MQVIEQLQSLREYVEIRDYSGYDPYDALNSPIALLFPFNRKIPRIALMQFMRRCPVNMRHLLRIRPDHNPKALGLFLDGYTAIHRFMPDNKTILCIHAILHLLNKYKTYTLSGYGWGYNFDWQNKVFFIPKYTPTIVNSSFIGHALLDVWECMGIKLALDLALPIKDFIIHDLNRLVEDESICFSYTPLDHYAVHNANLLGASFLYRIGVHLNDSEAKELALSALAYSMKYQRDDGAWKYSEQHKSCWIDSFHTGFNLESIRWFLRLNAAGNYVKAYQKGVHYYSNAFFMDDGTPKYYHNSVYPIDIHSPAEALSFFSQEGPEHCALCDRIAAWMLKNMYDKKGYVYFRKNRYFTNRIPYMRWGQAWAFRGLARYAFSQSQYMGIINT